MADYTPNYHLIKPAQEDYVNIEDINGNMDILDQKLKALEDIYIDLAGLDARVTRLEDMILYNITQNPYMVTFESLAEVTAEGVWNESQKRIEF